MTWNRLTWTGFLVAGLALWGPLGCQGEQVVEDEQPTDDQMISDDLQGPLAERVSGEEVVGEAEEREQLVGEELEGALADEIREEQGEQDQQAQRDEQDQQAQRGEQDRQAQRDEQGQQAQQGQQASYTATLGGLNNQALDSRPSGTVEVSMENDQLRITVEGRNLPPGVTVMQHIHGFTDDRQARCPTMDADQNGDGFVDVVESMQGGGEILVPLNDAPAEMAMGAEGFPTVGQDGTLQYEATVPMQQLRDALQREHGISEPNFDNYVVELHGVPEDTQLPASVQSIGNQPPQSTLPIGCGELNAGDEAAK